MLEYFIKYKPESLDFERVLEYLLEKNKTDLLLSFLPLFKQKIKSKYQKIQLLQKIALSHFDSLPLLLFNEDNLNNNHFDINGNGRTGENIFSLLLQQEKEKKKKSKKSKKSKKIKSIGK